MRELLRRHFGIAIAVILAFSTLVGGVGWAWPEARSLLAKHPGWGWSCAVIFAALAAFIALTDDKNLGRAREEIGDQRKVHESEIARRDAEIAELTTRLNPTPRDKELFEELLRRWPWEEGLIPWLNYAFNARSWEGKDADPLFQFVASWEEKFFDDQIMQKAFQEFYNECAALATWMSSNAAPDSQYKRTVQEGFRYSIANGNERDGGWPEMDRLRDVAVEHVRRIFVLRRPLEETGRRRGL
jgi:hypothetical protein